jgi:hypothetical protein
MAVFGVDWCQFAQMNLNIFFFFTDIHLSYGEPNKQDFLQKYASRYEKEDFCDGTKPGLVFWIEIYFCIEDEKEILN